jgi:hypothetical protein
VTTIAERVACRRCTSTYDPLGALVAHKTYEHGMAEGAARDEAAQDARACPGCGRRSGTHAPRCRLPSWRPYDAAERWPASAEAFTYAMPVLLPLRVAARAFRASYLGHVKRLCAGDVQRFARILGIRESSVSVTLRNAGVPPHLTRRCRLCGGLAHYNRPCPPKET